MPGNVFDITKATKNVLTATSPNDFIMQSDKNTFKIIASGTLLNQTVNSDPKTFSVAHGLPFTPTGYAWAKFPDGKVATPSETDFTETSFQTDGYGSWEVEIDATNIYFIFTKPHGNYNVSIAWELWEAPLNGTPNTYTPSAGNKLLITKPTYNVLTETNLNNFVFTSDKDTLKYYVLGSNSPVVDYSQYYHGESSIFGNSYYNRKVVTIAHNLGYIPKFVGYFLDAPTTGQAVQMPFIFADFIFFIDVSVYADATNIYFVYRSAVASNSGSITLSLKYRIFLNACGL